MDPYSEGKIEIKTFDRIVSLESIAFPLNMSDSVIYDTLLTLRLVLIATELKTIVLNNNNLLSIAGTHENSFACAI